MITRLQRALVLSLLAAPAVAGTYDFDGIRYPEFYGDSGIVYPEYRDDRWIDSHFGFTEDIAEYMRITVSDAAYLNAVVLMGSNARITCISDREPLKTAIYFDLDYEDYVYEHIKITLETWVHKGDLIYKE